MMLFFVWKFNVTFFGIYICIYVHIFHIAKAAFNIIIFSDTRSKKQETTIFLIFWRNQKQIFITLLFGWNKLIILTKLITRCASKTSKFLHSNLPNREPLELNVVLNAVVKTAVRPSKSTLNYYIVARNETFAFEVKWWTGLNRFESVGTSSIHHYCRFTWFYNKFAIIFHKIRKKAKFLSIHTTICHYHK